MLTFEPQDFSERDNYTLLTGSIIPRPIAFVTSSSNQDILNAAPFSYFNMVTADPPLISVSIQRKDGKSKDTVQNITEKQEFVVHIVDESNLQDVNQTAASLASNHNELDLTSFTLAKSLEIDVPGVQEARVRFECQLEKIIELGGDAKSPSTDLVI